MADTSPPSTLILKSMLGASAEANDIEPTNGGPSSMGAMMTRMTPWKRMPVTSTGAYSEPPSVKETPSRRRALESHTVSSSTMILSAAVSYSFTAFTSGGASPARCASAHGRARTGLRE